MNDWEPILRELADDPSDYEREAGVVSLVRQGSDHLLTLKDIPGSGTSVVISDTPPTYASLSTYVQRDLLGLPRLARQVNKMLDKAASSRPTFVEGPAEALIGKDRVHWVAVSKELAACLQESEPGTTRLIQLMAQAGQGKTVLLETIARDFAQRYHPSDYPTPILLPIDLLGRYVGTIDDAIAGSLNNTYLFPGLSQRDVALCIRKRWLVLALDGFDELVARVGAREAYLRITELLDQLNGCGTVIISARESFFELYQITSAIRSYLQPKVGSYATLTAKLLPWGHEQGVRVFDNLGSQEPARELHELLASFKGDEEIVLHPFFLTRLADLWRKGERFVDASQQVDKLARTRYVIDTFIARESIEKWRNREGLPLMDVKEHMVVLGVVAEEMWRSGAFRFTTEELKVAAEIGLSELQIVPERVEEILNRIPTHAALISRDRGYTFLHDRFFSFFLGSRVATLLVRKDRTAIERLLPVRELGPQVVEWIGWFLADAKADVREVVALLNDVSTASTDSVLPSNAALLTASLLRRYPQQAIVRKQTFVGDPFSGGAYSNIEFVECHFWHLDASGTKFKTCRFLTCTFGDMRIDAVTRFDGCIFDDSPITSIDVSGTWSLFSPTAIAARMRTLGAQFSTAVAPQEDIRPDVEVSADVSKCVERFLRASERTCDVAVEDIEDEGQPHGPFAKVVAQVGLKTNVLKMVAKTVHGKKKTFVRFRIDRQSLLPGQNRMTGDHAIDLFWKELRREYPK
jgi:hypothetical protein